VFEIEEEKEEGMNWRQRKTMEHS